MVRPCPLERYKVTLGFDNLTPTTRLWNGIDNAFHTALMHRVIDGKRGWFLALSTRQTLDPIRLGLLVLLLVVGRGRRILVIIIIVVVV